MYSDQLFISYKNSLRLKNLGFKDKCFKWYPHENLQTDDTIYLQYQEDDDFCFCPLYDQAFLFLFRKFNLHHEVFWDVDTKCFTFEIVEVDNNGEAWDIEINGNTDIYFDNPFDIKDIILTEMIDYLTK